jgi:3-isopropylmalate/(R)-2-methylmalate dehydratase small subunit
MKTVTREGLGEGCFAALRGTPGNPFEDERYLGAPILVAGANFGCGSSREHAVWALREIGIRAILAPSFGEIFEGNALRNGVVAARLPERVVQRLLELPPDASVTVDVERECVLLPDGKEAAFPLDPFRKQLLLSGRDEIDLTLELEPRIADYERRAGEVRPWMTLSPSTEEPSA